MGARVRVSGDSLEVVGQGQLTYVGELSSEDDPTSEQHLFAGTREGSGSAYLSSLRQALTKWIGQQRDRLPVSVALSSLPEERFVPYEDGPVTFLLLFKKGRLLIQLSRRHSKLAAARRLLAPVLKRHGASPTDLLAHDPDTLTVAWSKRGGTLFDAWDFHDEMQILLSAAAGGEITRSTVLDLLQARRWDLLRGQHESDWLEAKGAPYATLFKDLGNNWKFKLARDVAAFANSPQGGIIVIGLTTGERGDGEFINGHNEIDLREVKGPTYQKHVAQLVYPRVAGFEVRRIEGSDEGRGIAVLVVPPQPVSSRPFLVKGVLSEQKLLGHHVLLPVRRQDRTEWMDAAALHARLRLGEQAIAGEKPPGRGKR